MAEDDNNRSRPRKPAGPLIYTVIKGAGGGPCEMVLAAIVIAALVALLWSIVGIG